MPVSHATTPSRASCPWSRPCGLAADRAGGGGPDLPWSATHRPPSSRNSVETVRSAKVAMRIVPRTTTTPAAEALP